LPPSGPAERLECHGNGATGQRGGPSLWCKVQCRVDGAHTEPMERCSSCWAGGEENAPSTHRERGTGHCCRKHNGNYSMLALGPLSLGHTLLLPDNNNRPERARPPSGWPESESPFGFGLSVGAERWLERWLELWLELWLVSSGLPLAAAPPLPLPLSELPFRRTRSLTLVARPATR